MAQLLKRLSLVCACCLAFSGQAKADPYSDALKAFNDGDTEQGLSIFTSLAEQGDDSMQRTLGQLYYKGKYVPRDYKEAAKWWLLSARQGNAAAQDDLGELFELGKGTTQDFKEAVKWYRLAAEQGNTSGQRHLGGMYEKGHGVPQDYVLAHVWANLAAANSTDGDVQKKAIWLRDLLAKEMTANQIADAQERARECAANKFKGC